MFVMESEIVAFLSFFFCVYRSLSHSAFEVYFYVYVILFAWNRKNEIAEKSNLETS